MAKAATTTSAELIKQSEELLQQAEALKAQEAPEVLAKMKDAIAHYGFSAEDLGLSAKTSRKKAGPAKGIKTVKTAQAKKRKGASVPKYQDQNGHSWTGFGPKPKWFKEALAAGASEDSLRA